MKLPLRCKVSGVVDWVQIGAAAVESCERRDAHSYQVCEVQYRSKIDMRTAARCANGCCRGKQAASARRNCLRAARTAY